MANPIPVEVPFFESPYFHNENQKIAALKKDKEESKNRPDLRYCCRPAAALITLGILLAWAIIATVLIFAFSGKLDSIKQEIACINNLFCIL